MRNAIESTMLERYGEKARSDGCEFIIDPPANQLPQEVAALRPDAVAICPTEKRVIVARSMQGDTKQLVEAYNAALSTNSEWKFVLLWANELRDATNYINNTTADLVGKAKEIGRIPSDLPDARLLATFPILEGLGRLLVPRSGRSQLSASSLIEAIASAGIITPTQADRLRLAARKRQTLSHGGRSDPVTTDDISVVAEVIQELSTAIVNDVTEAKDRLSRVVKQFEEERAAAAAGAADAGGANSDQTK